MQQRPAASKCKGFEFLVLIYFSLVPTEEESGRATGFDLSDFAFLGIAVGCISGLAFFVGVIGHQASLGSR